MWINFIFCKRVILMPHKRCQTKGTKRRSASIYEDYNDQQFDKSE